MLVYSHTESGKQRNDSSSFENKFFYGFYTKHNITGSASTWKNVMDFFWLQLQRTDQKQFCCRFEIAFKDALERHLHTRTHTNLYIHKRVELQFSANIKWFPMMQSAVLGSIL